MLIALAWSSFAFCGEIHDAARDGDLGKIKALLKNNPDLVFRKDDMGMTPLLWAAANDHKEVVEFLLANKAEINAKENNFIGPAALAAALGQPNFKSDAKENRGLTPLGAAAVFGHRDIAELLLANKADVNAKDNEGMTPLHWAVALYHKDVAAVLLSHGADVNARDSEGTAPLHWAAVAGHKDLVELLLANDAYVNVKDNQGRTPLNYTEQNDNKSIAALLRNAPTPILMGASQFVRGNYILLLGSIGGTVILGFFYLRSKSGARVWHSIQLHLPLAATMFMLILTLSVGVWRWAGRSLDSSYERRLPKEVPTGIILVTVHLSNLNKTAASHMFPPEASSEHTQSGFVGSAAESQPTSVGGYSQFASRKQKIDYTHLCLAVCALPLGLVIVSLGLRYIPVAPNPAKGRLAFQALELFIVSGLAFAIVGCFLPWARCLFDKYIFDGSKLFPLDGSTFPVIGTDLLWGQVVLLCAIFGMSVEIVPLISQTVKGRQVMVVAWFVGLVISLIFLALQSNYIDSKTGNVTQGFIDALKASKWLYALPICLVTGIIIKLRLFIAPTQRIATVTLISVGGLLLVELLRLNNTVYDWNKITTGLPFDVEAGHLAACAGFFAATMSGLALSMCLLWYDRRKTLANSPQTVNQTNYE